MRSRAKSKANLFLIELVIMLMFFAVAAAICLGIFSQAQLTSQKANSLSNASLKAQSAAECYKAANGDLNEAALLLGGEVDENGSLMLCYDGKWQQVPLNAGGSSGKQQPECRFVIEIAALPDGGAALSVTNREKDELILAFSLGAVEHE